jgi:hypothetical protein
LSTYKSWRDRDISIVLDDEQTDDPVTAVEIMTPIGAIKVMAVVVLDDRCLTLSGLHIQPVGMSNLRFGVSNLRRLADAVMEGMGFDELRIEGAPRTTGANKGRRQILWLKRRFFPES